MLEKRDDSARQSRLFYFMALGLVQMNPYCLNCGEELEEGDDGVCPRCVKEQSDDGDDDDEEYE